jgi:hypothetical protein
MPEERDNADALLVKPGDELIFPHDSIPQIKLHCEIEITYNPEMISDIGGIIDEETGLVGNNWQDIEAGVHYDEDLTEVELEWKRAGFPMCKGCGQEPYTGEDFYCYTCEYRNQQEMYDHVFDDLVEAGKVTFVERHGEQVAFYNGRRVKVIPTCKNNPWPKSNAADDYYVDYHDGDEYEGWGVMEEGWYIRSYKGECGACCQCQPDGPYSDPDEAEEAIEKMFDDGDSAEAS